MGCFCDEHILFLNLEGKRGLKKNQMGYLTDGKLIFFVWRKFLQINNKDNTPTKRKKISQLRALQFSSVTQLCPTLCDLMNRSTPGLPVHHHLPEFIRYRYYNCCSYNCIQVQLCLPHSCKVWMAPRFLIQTSDKGRAQGLMRVMQSFSESTGNKLR